MQNIDKNPKKNIDRRQFIRKTVLGFLGVGTAIGLYKIGLSFSRESIYPHSSLPDPILRVPSDKKNALFLTEHQYATVATLAALIVPTDDYPGAKEAGVVDYIVSITETSKGKRAFYAKGIKWLDKFCNEKFGKDFLTLDASKQNELLTSAFEKLRSGYDKRNTSGIVVRVVRKITEIWDNIDVRFFSEVRKDVLNGFYSNPISWKEVGYFGPPNPVGYMNFTEPPSPADYSDSIRLVDNFTCNTCHEKGEHPRGGLINHTCTTCHRPHSPWPYDNEAFYLEDHIGIVFSNPDRKKEDM